ncbi:MAG: NAD(P)/FAD-dependent oxidoreductase [Anaerolineae bacterium]|nr:NAD(P)/FAD-dependent oxidoreductase [Anaerolineae bacterium]
MDYDVIIVGGRPAGSTLAARLGAQHLKVLLLERAAMPSLPAASSPIIYSPALKLLDEIGAPEDEYAHHTPPIRRVIGHAAGFSAVIPIPEAHGRDYAYAIDRARFDHALWTHAQRFNTVTARDNFNVTELLWDGDRVVGIVGSAGKHAPEERITARLVIGADGRFSVVARKTNAAEHDVHNENPTSLYYAYWKNVRPYDEHGPAAVAYEGGVGYGFLVMDSADGRTGITFEGQADLLNPEPGKITAFYLDLVNSNPHIRARIAEAEMVTDVHGMRRIGNLYRQPGGEGWALVGDAYHQHDPLDGQGIFNALFTAKALAQAVRSWNHGQKIWTHALADYDETTRIKTYGMYKRTLDQVRQNLYSPAQVPGWALNGIRWVMEDPAMHWLMGQMLTRQLPAEVVTLLTPGVAVGAMMRGSLRDLRKMVGF